MGSWGSSQQVELSVAPRTEEVAVHVKGIKKKNANQNSFRGTKSTGGYNLRKACEHRRTSERTNPFRAAEQVKNALQEGSSWRAFLVNERREDFTITTTEDSPKDKDQQTERKQFSSKVLLH
ncbi:Hypothetical protein SMAX5B_013243 [Scophthalmus maximus]|uniref:Uncharacterized protein n=1 Tax=Scophthalmus maximus TaxID=52904 RepID=A0A2U9B6U0_SCOMX|nr:Hypothetical protein SMAX5B_013243 [Scophthalmus maximus]